MLREHSKAVSIFEIIIDYVLALIPVGLLFYMADLMPSLIAIAMVFAYAVLKLGSLNISKLYHSRRRLSFLEYHSKLGTGLVLYYGISAILLGVFFLYTHNTGIIAYSWVFFFSDVSITMIKSILSLLLVYMIRYYGYNIRQVVLVGAPQEVTRAYKYLKKNRWGFRVVGYITDYASSFLADIKYLGHYNDFATQLSKEVIDEVIFIKSSYRTRDKETHYETASKVSKEQGKLFSVFNLNNHHFEQVIRNNSNKMYYLYKDTFDIFVAIFMLIVSLPIMLVVALAIKLDSPGPILFKQTRVGKNGRLFNMYKFRTMMDGSDQQKDNLLQFNEMSGPVFKMKNDPRLTSIGKFLRNSSLDELPQLYNVIKGEMSLVGPRPPVPSEVSKYESKHHKRLAVKPGITCIWQVSGRNLIDSFEEWVKLDSQYVDRQSFFTDMKILVKTVGVLITRKGAR